MSVGFSVDRNSAKLAASQMMPSPFQVMQDGKVIITADDIKSQENPI